MRPPLRVADRWRCLHEPRQGRHHRRRRIGALPPDAGVTLIEMVIAMTLTSVFLVVVAATFITMYRTSSKADSISEVNTQAAMAFDRLDSSVRYAAAISTPGMGGDGNWYVEWNAADPSSAACTQLRLDIATAQLQQRSWDFDDDATVTDLSSWLPLASEVTAAVPSEAGASEGSAGSVAPFSLVDDDEVPHQQLGIHVRIGDGSGQAAAPTDLAITFTALNSRRLADPGPICQQVARS